MTKRYVIGLGVLVVLVGGGYLFLSRADRQPAAPRFASGSELKTVNIPVEGMSCMVCAASVKKGLKNVQGVTEVEVSLEGHNAKVSYQPGKVDPELLAKTINELGYKAGEPVAENRK